MFRLVVLFASLALAAAAPSGAGLLAYSSPLRSVISEPTLIHPGYTSTVVKPELQVVEQPTVAHVGNYVKSFPTAVSHQSQTIVHDKADIVEPILAPAVQKTLVPSLKSYSVHQPAIAYSAPLTYAAHSPLTYAAQSPLVYGASSPYLSAW